MKIFDIKVDRSRLYIFSSFEEAEEAERKYWHLKTPEERLEAVELMRQLAYRYDDPETRRLPGNYQLEIIRIK